VLDLKDLRGMVNSINDLGPEVLFNLKYLTPYRGTSNESGKLYLEIMRNI